MTNRTFLTQGQLEQVAAHYGAAEQAVALEHEQWLLFMLGEEIFSLSMNELDEISEISSGVAIPSLKKHVIGLISVRGEPMVLVDTAQAIGLAPTETLDSAQRVLVLKGSEEQTAGFLVDSIVKVTELSDWQSIGEDDQKHQSRFVDAISEYDNKGVSKLNLHKLVSCIDI